MPFPQAYVSIVDPTSGIVQEYVTLVDSSGNLVYAANQTPQGRLTLTTAVPVLTTAVATAATVYYTPYTGNIVPCWNGTRFSPEVFTELSNVLANSSTGNAGPAAGAASKNYDLFVWKSGTTLYLTRGAAWNSDTARSATTENDLQRVNGVLCNLNAITNGPAAGYGTYVGTVRTDAAGATVSWSPGGSAAGGTPATLNVWNMYNRVRVTATVSDSTASWTYANAASVIRPSNNSAGNRASFVRGLNDETMEASFTETVSVPASAGVAFGGTAFGLDATNATVAAPNGVSGGVTTNTNTFTEFGKTAARYAGLPGLGFHFLQAVEFVDTTSTITFYGGSNHQITLTGMM